MATPTIPPLFAPSEAYWIFTGSIDQDAIRKFSIALAGASGNSLLKTLHLAFQSNGGGIGEGIALYNIFQALPFDLVLYNIGTVSSIAVIAYLGAPKRKVSSHGAFMIHRTQTNAQWVNTNTIKAFADSAVLSDKRTEDILRKHIKMPEVKWAHFDHHDLWFSAEEGVEFGIADEIAEFRPPSGYQLYYL